MWPQPGDVCCGLYGFLLEESAPDRFWLHNVTQQSNRINLFSPRGGYKVLRVGVSPWSCVGLVPGLQLGFLPQQRHPPLGLHTRWWRCRAECPEMMILQPKMLLDLSPSDLSLCMRGCDSREPSEEMRGLPTQVSGDL